MVENNAKNFEKFMYGGLAGRLYNPDDQNSSRIALGALEQLASDFGIEESARGFIEGALSSDQGVQVAIGTYAKKFEDASGSLKVSEFYDLNKGLVAKYAAGNIVAKVEELVGKYKDNSIKEIKEKVIEAQEIMKSKVAKRETKVKAKETFDKYKEIITLIGEIEEGFFEGIRQNAVDRALKRSFERYKSE